MHGQPPPGPEAGQTLVRARVWPEWEPEPTTWQIDCVDAAADRLVAGTIGVWSMGPGEKYWDDLAVFALDGSGTPVPLEPPPPPVLLVP